MWYLIVSIPDLCTLTYFDELASVLPTVYRHIENMLEIHVCFTNHAHLLPTKLDKCRYFGSGKFGFSQGKVREMSGNFAFYNLWEPCLLYFIFL